MPVHCRKNNSIFFSDFPSGVGLTGELQIPTDADLVAENNVGSASDSWKVLDGQERPNPTLACSFVSGFLQSLHQCPEIGSRACPEHQPEKS